LSEPEKTVADAPRGGKKKALDSGEFRVAPRGGRRSQSFGDSNSSNSRGGRPLEMGDIKCRYSVKKKRVA